MGKNTQKQIVYEIVKQAGNYGIRTERAEIEGLRRGISGGSTGRYLRWLAEEGRIEGERKKGDKTHTWTLCEPENRAFPENKDTRSIPEIQRDEAIGKTRFEAELAKRVHYKQDKQLSIDFIRAYKLFY